MRLLPKSWRGLLINDETNYISDFADNSPLVSAGTMSFLDMLDTPPVPTSRRLASAFITILVQPQVDFRDNREVLREYFRTEERLTYYEFIVIDQDDDDREWFIDAAVVSVVPENDAFIVVLTPKFPYWQTEAIEQTELFDVSEETHSFTVDTNSPHIVHPVITIEPVTPRDGAFSYEKWIPIKHWGIPATRIPYDFGNGFDSAALVTAGKMQSTGYDCRLVINGVMVPRYLSEFNTTSTKMWSKIDLPAIKPLYLRSSIASSGAVTEIQFTDDQYTEVELAKWPASGELVIDNEGFKYTSKDMGTRSVKGISRELKGTSMAAHTINDLAFVQPFDARMVYGNATAPDPGYSITDFRFAPCIDMDDSTNEHWFLHTFSDWKGVVFPRWSGSGGIAVRYNNVLRYQGTYLLPEAAGLALGVWASFDGVTWRPNTLKSFWTFASPFRMSSFNISGQKLRTQSDFPSFFVSTGQTQEDVRVVFSIFTPAASSTLEDWVYNHSISFSDKYINLVLDGSIAGTAYNNAYITMTDFDVTFYTVDVPVCFHASEQSSYDYDMLIENEDTGHSIKVLKKVGGGSPIVIDTQNHTIRVNGLDSSGGITPSDKREWFKLLAGPNTIKVTETGLTGVNLTMSGNAERGV